MNIATELAMVGLLAVCGFALLAFYMQHPDLLPEGWTMANSADRLFPHFLSSQLPAGCAGLVMSAFLCDAIQTLEAGVNSITAVVTTDLLPRRSRTDSCSGKPRSPSLMFVRMLSIVITLGVSLNAVFVAQLAINGGMTLIDMMPKFFNMFIGPLAAMFLIGMFLPRCTVRSTSIAVILGVITAVLWNWGKEIFQTSVGPTILLAIACPCLVTVGSAALLSLILEDRKSHPGQRYTWTAIVRGQTPASPASEALPEATPSSNSPSVST